ncbi:MAG: glycosyltransferase [Nanoarchaeota archaeon]|nr:glycosyltransferase [Nanoarchaeota archaeon]
MEKDYEVKVVWMLNTFCNYDCEYCYISKETRKINNQTKEQTDKIIKFFNNTDKKYLIYMSGGEPTLYPNFVKLCKELTKKHFISLDTNLSTNFVYDFIKEIDPKKVKWVQCSLHIKERERHNQTKDYLKKISALKKAGFNVLSNQIMHPRDFKLIEKTIKFFHKHNIPITPKFLKGKYKGKTYPDDYTKKEKDWIKKIQKYGSIKPLMESDNSIKRGIPSYKGLPCATGRKMIVIKPNGNIFRCSDDKNCMGNAFTGKLKLNTYNKPCEAEKCMCYIRGMEYIDKKYLENNKPEKVEVSIIIPARNSEKTLKKCLESISNLNYKNFEALIVNNNSTDRTKKIILEFAKKDPRIKYLFEKEIGTGAARYCGEKEAKGDIIMMTDSDCIVPENWIQEMTQPIKENKTRVVQGLKKPFIKNYWTEQIQKEKEQTNKLSIKKNKVGLVDTANFAIKKDFLQNAGHSNPDIKYSNDTELMLRLLNRKYKINLVDTSVLHNEPDTARKIFKKQIIRGEENQKIRELYNKENNFFEKENPINNLKFIKNTFLNFLTLNENASYDFVSGLGWRIGKLKSKLKKGYLKKIQCPICNWQGPSFLPYKKTENRQCPRCNSFERHRFLYLYLKRILNKEKIKLLHIAPEKGISKYLKDKKNIEYLSIDIDEKRAMKKADITNLPFENNSFDLIICNHILEHINNDKKAISELAKVLKKGGQTIISVPLSINKRTIEDPKIKTDEDRERVYQYKGHVRLYGTEEFPELLNKKGFKVTKIESKQFFPKETVNKFVLGRDVLHLCEKL